MPPRPKAEATYETITNTMLIDQSKKQQFGISQGLKEWTKRLRNSWKIVTNQSELSLEILQQAKVAVICGPHSKFTGNECLALKNYIEGGGSVLVMLGEGGESKNNTNINYILEQFGVNVNADSVIRTSYYKYFHPKEAVIADGVLNRGLALAAGKAIYGEELELNSQAFTYLYPFGASLNVVKPSIPVLSTGGVAFPVQRPVVSFYKNKNDGRLVVVGSVMMFHDNYVDKEENLKLIDVFLDFLTKNENVELDGIDANDPDITDYHMCPHISELAEQPKGSLQESDDIPRDLTKLFNDSVYAADMSFVPTILNLYKKFKMEYESLKVITPQFETPLPALKPAVFPPHFQDLPPPKLELFDLDEEFSSEHVRLAQITNKCAADTDLEYYVRECGHILNITKSLATKDAKNILHHIMMQVAEYKKINQS